MQGTILGACWKPSFARHLIPKQNRLRRDLVRYLDYYNPDRAHTGRWTRGRTPEDATRPVGNVVRELAQLLTIVLVAG